MELYVAKSYQGLPVVEEPYKKGGKTYCKVKMKSGAAKEVRSISAIDGIDEVSHIEM